MSLGSRLSYRLVAWLIDMTLPFAILVALLGPCHVLGRTTEGLPVKTTPHDNQ